MNANNAKPTELVSAQDGSTIEDNAPGARATPRSGLVVEAMATSPSVTALVTRARNGDKQAWDQLVERYAPLIWSICRRYRLGGADAADVGQSVWLRLVDQLASLRDPAALPGWLATTTQRECGRAVRVAQKEVPADRLDAAGIPDKVTARTHLTGRHHRPTGTDHHLIRTRATAVPDALTHLQFRRYSGCPICNLHLHSVARRCARRPGRTGLGPAAWVAGFDEAVDTVEAMMPEPRSEEQALRSKFMLIFRGGAVARHDLSPSELQAHVEKWYRWSDELARQGRGNVGTALDNPGAAVRGHERVVTDGPYAESKDLVTGSLIFEAASLEDAIDVARTCPTYEFGGSVEVRPVQDHRI